MDIHISAVREIRPCFVACTNSIGSPKSVRVRVFTSTKATSESRRITRSISPRRIRK